MFLDANKLMKKTLLVLLVCALVLTGCAGQQPNPTNGETVGTTASPSTAVTTTPPTEPTQVPTTQPVAPTEPTQAPTTQPTQPPEPEDTSLPALRQAMTDAGQFVAVAYLGLEYSPEGDAGEVIQSLAPQFCEDYPFLGNIPAESIYGEMGDIFCIVPRDPNAKVTVYHVMEDANGCIDYSQIVLERDSGEPFLLFANCCGIQPDMLMIIENSDGTINSWHPQLNDNHFVDQALDPDWQELILDFSPYKEMLTNNYLDRLQYGWVLPTADQLINTSWGWDGWLMDGRYVQYYVTFHENTVDVSWSDGYSDEFYVYNDAPYTLTHEDGFAVLTIDFQEFAGVMRFDILIDMGYCVLYTMVDVTVQDVTPGWDALYRSLGMSVG